MATTTTDNQTFLEFFPLTLFGSVSTLSSLSFAWGFMGTPTGLWMKQAFAITAIALFLLFSVIYLFKWIKYPDLIKKEFNDPVAVNLFGVFFISLLLVSGLLRAYDMQLALVVWSVGTLLNFLFAYMVVTRWISQQQNPTHALPVWAIPVLGLLDIPITGYAYQSDVVHEICLIFLASGVLFTLIVIIMIFQRIIFQEGIAPNLQPTLLLLSAPFALLFAGYEQITGRQDLVAILLFYMSIVVLLLFGRRMILCLMHVQFTITWWATSFPLAAVCAASFRYAAHTKLPAADVIPVILLIISTLIFVVLVFQTVHYIIAHFLIKTCPKPSQRLSLQDMIKSAKAPVKINVTN